ncbi:hypothetical protein FQN52_005379 [Onygenales sp. PD_12]|nr:hypothetical protein FQN52_005379 [Onygenales sp. PD_12]
MAPSVKLGHLPDSNAHPLGSGLSPNLVSAAFFIAGLLDRHGIIYGLMGGFAVKLMGDTRNTRDVDIAFQAPGGMRDLWRVVEPEPCLVIPNTKLLSNMMKLFVLTGPGYDNSPTAPRVEVDLIENGIDPSAHNHRYPPP